MRNISWLFVCFVCIIWCLMGLVRVRVRAKVWFGLCTKHWSGNASYSHYFVSVGEWRREHVNAPDPYVP